MFSQCWFTRTTLNPMFLENIGRNIVRRNAGSQSDDIRRDNAINFMLTWPKLGILIDYLKLRYDIDIYFKMKCECKPGYEGDGWSCREINSCLRNNGNCPSLVSVRFLH